MSKALLPIVPDCRACKYCGLDDMDFVCFHPDGGIFGKWVRVASTEGGHCGPLKPKFEQHPLRGPNGELAPIGD